jgi:adenosine deaminase
MKKKLTLTTEQSSFYKLLQDLPKTEIHLHLEGIASVDTIWSLMNKNKIIHPDIKTKNDLEKKFNVANLDEFIDLFINVIQRSFSEEKDIHLLIEDAGKYLEENNITYAEIFFAPSKFVSMGFNFGKIIKILENGAIEIKEKYNREIRFLIDVSRTFGPENAMKNLDLTIENKSPYVIGIGLGGSESKGPAEDYQKVFKKAAKHGFHVVAHAGEDVGPESVWNTLKLLKAERIGHGISSIQDEKLMEYLVKTQATLEICPTSNLFTKKYVKTLEEHPVREFFDRKINVTINTDDPTLFSITLIEEYMNLYLHKIFSKNEIIQLIKNNVYSTFLKKQEQDDIWNRCLEVINR